MLNKYMKNLNENKYVRVEMELDTKTICIVSKYIQNCLVISFHFFKFMDVLQFLYYYGRKDTIAYASLFIYLVSCNMFMTDIMIFFTSLWSWGSLLLSYVLHHLNKRILIFLTTLRDLSSNIPSIFVPPRSIPILFTILNCYSCFLLRLKMKN